jgi:uncharacterized protein
MRALKRVLVSLLLVVGLFYALGGWHFSNVIDERALDGEARRAAYPGEYDLTVRAVGKGTIDLVPMGDPPPALTTDGEWGLNWLGGYGWVRTQGSRHSFQVVAGTPPRPGWGASLDARMYPDADHIPTRHVVQNIGFPGPLGDYPAWFWPGERSAWAIVVHGNSMTPLDGARVVPAFERLGFPVLVPTYRNDPDAPVDPSGKLRYGQTEWEDLEASVRYALDNGATDVILDGYSMGGGVIMAFMQRSDLADRVTAIVLDAPMLDFGQTVDDNASRETLPVLGLPLPQSLTAVAKQLAAWRFGVDWEALDYLGTDPSVPVLIFHGTEDLTVPIGTSVDFARRYPDVTLERCPGAGHIECWNVDSALYEQRLTHFVREFARVESGVLSCPPGSLIGGAVRDGAEPAPTLRAALAREDVGAGSLKEVPVPEGRTPEIDVAYVLVRDGFPVRLYLVDHTELGWAVPYVNSCGDTGDSG